MEAVVWGFTKSEILWLAGTWTGAAVIVSFLIAVLRPWVQAALTYISAGRTRPFIRPTGLPIWPHVLFTALPCLLLVFSALSGPSYPFGDDETFTGVFRQSPDEQPLELFLGLGRHDLIRVSDMLVYGAILIALLFVLIRPMKTAKFQLPSSFSPSPSAPSTPLSTRGFVVLLIFSQVVALGVLFGMGSLNTGDPSSGIVAGHEYIIPDSSNTESDKKIKVWGLTKSEFLSFVEILVSLIVGILIFLLVIRSLILQSIKSSNLFMSSKQKWSFSMTAIATIVAGVTVSKYDFLIYIFGKIE